jgi:hypothetical protein
MILTDHILNVWPRAIETSRVMVDSKSPVRAMDKGDRLWRDHLVFSYLVLSTTFFVAQHVVRWFSQTKMNQCCSLKGPVTDPTGPSTDPSPVAYRVLRGGSYNRPARRCRSAERSGDWPGYRTWDIGFRLVRTATLFTDGFESGDTSAWSSTIP